MENNGAVTGNARISDQDIVSAIGNELHRARIVSGMSKRDVAGRTKPPIPWNTYYCYELGRRLAPIPRLIEICEALGVSAVDVQALAFQRLELEVGRALVLIDLRKITADDRKDTIHLRKWAGNRISANPQEPTVIRLPREIINEVWLACGISPRSIRQRIRDYTPDCAPSYLPTKAMKS